MTASTFVQRPALLIAAVTAAVALGAGSVALSVSHHAGSAAPPPPPTTTGHPHRDTPVSRAFGGHVLVGQ
jgi:hypothetical protein